MAQKYVFSEPFNVLVFLELVDAVSAETQVKGLNHTYFLHSNSILYKKSENFAAFSL